MTPSSPHGQELDLAVAVGMVGVGRAVGEPQGITHHRRGDEIDDGLQRIAEDGGGVGDPEGQKLQGHDAQAGQQRVERDTADLVRLGVGLRIRHRA